MGQFVKVCERTFHLKMADSTAILVSIFSILMLDQFPRRRKMRISEAHLQYKNQQSKYFLFESYNCFEQL